MLLRNGVYHYEFMDDWWKFDETLLPEKEEFYHNLNMKDITNLDYSHRKKNLKRFWNKKFGWISWIVS